MPACPNCEDGITFVEENGRRVPDACYTCGNTGVITEEHASQINFERTVNQLALRYTLQLKRSHNEAFQRGDVDEPWAFAAAENGIREIDLFNNTVYHYSEMFGQFLTNAPDELKEALTNALTQND